MFPKALSPNNDGVNDVFEILNTYHLIFFHCTIFNRWGQKVFELNDPGNGWDGRVKAVHARVGTYLWICNYSWSGNTNISHLQGLITLIR